MTDPLCLRRGRLRCLAFIGLVLVMLLAPSPSPAQVLDEQDEVVVVPNGFELDESNFNQWVFGNGNGPRIVSAREHLDSLLVLKIGEIENTCPLTEAQKRKLLLAGQGDRKRFMDRVAEARKVFDRLRRDQNNINEIYQETQPLAASLGNGLFNEGSFFAKTLGSTLEPEQASRYTKALRDKVLFRYKAKVSLALANLDSVVGFTAEQYRRYLALILEETTPPEKPAGQYEANVVLLKIAQVPESLARPIFDESRWKTLSRQFQQARGMEPFLRANGFLPQPESAKTKRD